MLPTHRISSSGVSTTVATVLMTLAASAATPAQPPAYSDRFVWVFGYNLERAADAASVTNLVRIAGDHGLNGAVLSAGLDTLCKHPPDYFAHLAEVQRAGDQAHVELIPSLFSVGYGGAGLAHNPNLAEGVPVAGAPFLVSNGWARFVPDDGVRIMNGGFEDHAGQQFKGMRFHDQPGVVNFVDTQEVRTGKASLRLEHFDANPHGHGRVMQEVSLTPHRCYRLSVWVKTDGLRPGNSFQMLVLAEDKDRNIAPRTFALPAVTDWRRLTTLFNSLEFDRVRLYVGVWGAQAGRLWLDDWSIEEVGPLNVLHRPGTPVSVRSDDGATNYVEGQDYAPLTDTRFSLYRPDHEPALLQLPAGSRIASGQRLRVSWYHPMIIHDSQITVCMAEPELYQIFDHEAGLLAQHLKPRRFLLNMDEIRMGGTCRACADRNLAELLGGCITREVEILRRHFPAAQVYVWSDMLDPNHNAHGDYYLASGDFTGSWNHVPRDLVMAVWGGEPRRKSVEFFAGQRFPVLIACYYDAADLRDVTAWLEVTRGAAGVRGFMYTPWERKYALLPAFGDLIRQGPAAP